MDSNSTSMETVCSGDFFDRLSDDVVLSIFGKLQDAKSLCLSMSVCKRFRSIAPLVDQIFLPIPQKKPAASDQKNSVKNAVIRALMKPFNFISQMIRLKPKSEESDLDFYSYYVPNEILKNFGGIRALHLRLPCHGNQKKSGKSCSGKSSTTFLRWRAEFGRELHSCVILGAKSWSAAEKKAERVEDSSPYPSQSPSRVMADDELKLRIVWTISCLIAASARHYLMQETVKGLKMIENVVVSDESGQGRLCMNKQQIEEIRGVSKGDGDDEVAESRSRVPALRMKMWYLDRLELPGSGRVMEGATLVVIRPAAGGEAAEKAGKSDAEMVAEGLGGEEGEGKVIGEAVRKLMVAKKCYVLEMNSF